MERRYPGKVTDALRERLEYEIGVVKKMGYTNYYLIVYDFINYAKSRDIPVGPGRGDEIGHQLGRDGIPRLGLPVLPGVAEIGDNRRNPGGGRPLEGVHHDQQLHEMVVDRRAHGLDDKHVGAPHRFVDGHRDFPVAEGSHLGLAHRQPQRFGNLPRQHPVGIGGKNFDVLAVKIHAVPRSSGCPAGSSNFHLKQPYPHYIMAKKPAVFKPFPCNKIHRLSWEKRQMVVERVNFL